MAKRRGVSYQKRVTDINRIYDEHAKRGVPNREIWRRYVYPVYGISERTFYNILNASSEPKNEVPKELDLFFGMFDEKGSTEDNPQYLE